MIKPTQTAGTINSQICASIETRPSKRRFPQLTGNGAVGSDAGE